MDDGKRYHVPVFKIKETLLCIGMSIVVMMVENTCAGVSNKGDNTLYRNVNKMKGVGLKPLSQSDWCLKPAFHTTRQSRLYVLTSITWMMVGDTICRGSI